MPTLPLLSQPEREARTNNHHSAHTVDWSRLDHQRGDVALVALEKWGYSPATQSDYFAEVSIRVETDRAQVLTQQQDVHTEDKVQKRRRVLKEHIEVKLQQEKPSYIRKRLGQSLTGSDVALALIRAIFFS